MLSHTTKHTPASLVILEFHLCQALHLFQGLLVYQLHPEKQHMSVTVL